MAQTRFRAPVPLLLVFAVLAGTAALYWPSVSSLIGQWSLGTYRHGWVVAILSGLLIVQARHAIAESPVRPDVAAAALLCIVGLAWAILFKANIQVAHQLLWPLLAWLAICSFLGRAIARECAFALGFIYFAVPVWSVLVPLLQAVAVGVVGRLLAISSISAVIQGNVVHLADGDILVSGDCSGLNYLVVALTVATLLGEVQRADWILRMRLIAVASVLALIGNWLRIYWIIRIAVSSHMKSSLVRAHAQFGWYVFAAVMLVFFLIASRMRLIPRESRRFVDDPRHAQGADMRVVATVAATVALALGPALVASAPRVAVHAVATRALPEPVSGWEGPAPPASDWMPVFPAADAVEAGMYRDAGGTVEEFKARYVAQRQDHKILSSENSIVGDPRKFSVVERHPVAGAEAINESVIEDMRRQRWLLWYGYRVGARSYASPWSAALWYGLTSLRDTPVADVGVLRTQCADDCATARVILNRFWNAGNIGR